MHPLAIIEDFCNDRVQAFMLDWHAGNKEQDGEDNQVYELALRALHSEAMKVSAQVEEMENSLEESYAGEALSELSKRFETISKNFTRYTLVERHEYYQIIRRSRSRLSAVNRIAREAKTLARLFERYARKPQSYSASACRIQIGRLQAQFENLKESSLVL